MWQSNWNFSLSRARAGVFARLMNEDTVVAACARAMNVFNWQNFSDAQKQEVLRLCRQRLLRKIRANKAVEPEEPQQPSLF
ncbi:putative oxidoreductase [Enterobacter hormaechei]|nr:putative oxidoreductase [Enterobacter hormaechei]